MHNLFDITYLVTNYGYVGILFIIFLESGIFFPLPGDSLIFTAGLLAPTLGFSVVFLAFLIFIAAFLGGLVGYFIGTKLEFLQHHPLFKRILRKEYVDEAHNFFQKHGLSAMVLGRFVPVVRTFLPIVAGMVKMDYGKFIKYSLLGSAVWSALFVFAGYFLGRAFPQIENYLMYVIIIIVLLSIVPGLNHFIARRRKEIEKSIDQAF